MELTFLQQSTAFLYSLLLGIGVGVFYGILKIVRIIFCKGRVSVFVIDFVFITLASLSAFVFSVAFLWGSVRLFAIFGMLAGFLTYRLTLGRLFEKIYRPVIKILGKAVSKILLKIKKITKKLLKITYNILYNIINIRSIFRNKSDCLKEDNISDE